MLIYHRVASLSVPPGSHPVASHLISRIAPTFSVRAGIGYGVRSLRTTRLVPTAEITVLIAFSVEGPDQQDGRHLGPPKVCAQESTSSSKARDQALDADPSRCMSDH